ncbi:MAG: TonB-dependent receptor, partial [Bacteroidetes bacterium]|nr:TonB-dependent receptor [Bacteroidota bacterium]
NDAGDTYLITSAEKIIDRSKKIVGEVQHSTPIGEIQRFTYGANVFLTRPNTEGTIFGRNEDNDDINEFGGYLQSETGVIPDGLSLILAGRVDWHSEFADPVFSPRAGLVITPAVNQKIRLTWNRAYATPAPADFFLDLLAEPDVFRFADKGIGEYRYGARGVGVPATGYSFERIPGVGLTFHSTYVPDRSQAIPVAAGSELWSVPLGFVIAAYPDLATLLSQIPEPTPEDVGSVMGMLNLETEGFDPVTDSDVRSVPRLKPMVNQTIEAGYKGIIGRDVQIDVGAYYSMIKDFITSQQLFTPNVLLNGSDVYNYMIPYLLAGGLSRDTAEAIVEAMSSVPLGTVSPIESTDPTELLLAPTNAGDIDYWGVDLSVVFSISRSISCAGTYSYISQNYFEDLAGYGDLSLNAPKHKGSASVRYRASSSGFLSEIRYRYVDGFRVKSAVYRGVVKSYGLIDLLFTYPLAFAPGTKLKLAATNVLGHRHIEFVGAPEIGRMVTAQLSYGF